MYAIWIPRPATMPQDEHAGRVVAFLARQALAVEAVSFGVDGLRIDVAEASALTPVALAMVAYESEPTEDEVAEAELMTRGAQAIASLAAKPAEERTPAEDLVLALARMLPAGAPERPAWGEVLREAGRRQERAPSRGTDG